jgi:hypothetical protein
MKISQDTINILKNFSQINQGIFFKKGDTISTISPQKNILVEATVKESFPNDFGIYDLPNFLSVLSLSKDDPELSFYDKHLTLSGHNGRSTITYRYTDASMIVCPPDKKLTVPSAVATFHLDENDLSWISRCVAILQQPNMSIESDGDAINITTFDATNDSSHTQKLQIAKGNGESFKFVLRTENIKLISTNYTVAATKGIVTFTGKNIPIKYWIATEKMKE